MRYDNHDRPILYSNWIFYWWLLETIEDGGNAFEFTATHDLIIQNIRRGRITDESIIKNWKLLGTTIIISDTIDRNEAFRYPVNFNGTIEFIGEKEFIIKSEQEDENFTFYFIKK